MFERFTERARQVIVYAQDDARSLNHNHIGTEHVLLGLLRVEEGLAARVLAIFDVAEEEVRADVARIVGVGEKPVAGQMPFTPRAKKVLELTKRESESLGHNYIGTEHLLLGLLSENEGVGMRILAEHGADAAAVRDELTRMLSTPARAVARAASGTSRGPQLVIACPHCATPLETVGTDRPNVRFEVHAEGDRVCSRCGRRWTVAYTVSWTELPPG